jgi:hypothetical protein
LNLPVELTCLPNWIRWAYKQTTDHDHVISKEGMILQSAECYSKMREINLEKVFDFLKPARSLQTTTKARPVRDTFDIRIDQVVPGLSEEGGERAPEEKQEGKDGR